MINEVSNEILKIPYNEMFHVEHVKVDIPEKARIFTSLKCSQCGEMVSNTIQTTKWTNYLHTMF